MYYICMCFLKRKKYFDKIMVWLIEEDREIGGEKGSMCGKLGVGMAWGHHLCLVDIIF